MTIFQIEVARLKRAELDKIHKMQTIQQHSEIENVRTSNDNATFFINTPDRLIGKINARLTELSRFLAGLSKINHKHQQFYKARIDTITKL